MELPASAAADENSPTPVPSEGRFQAFPEHTITQPQGEEKYGEVRQPHLPLLRRKGSAIFSISSALDALDPEYCEKIHLDVSSWLVGLFYPHYHLHPGEDQE